MLGISYPVTQHCISEQSPVLNRETAQYGLLLPGSRKIQIQVSSTFEGVYYQKLGIHHKVHLEGQITEVHLIRNCFL